MKALALSALISLVAAGAAHAQVEGHRILFPDSLGVPEDDQRAIYGLLGYTVSADGTALEVVDCGPIFSTVEVADLNEDGTAEIFVVGGNSCTSGSAERSIHLFVKNAEGGYAMHFGFPAGGWRALETSNLGFSDVAIGGQGFCEGVWRWDGTTYQHHHNEAVEPGGCDEVG